MLSGTWTGHREAELQSDEISSVHSIPVRLNSFRAMLGDVPLQDAGQMIRDRGAASVPSWTALLHPISHHAEPEALLSAGPLSCVFMPFRHSISHKCRVTRNDSLGEVPGNLSTCSLRVCSSTEVRFHPSQEHVFCYLGLLHWFFVCFFCHGHITR